MLLKAGRSVAETWQRREVECVDAQMVIILKSLTPRHFGNNLGAGRK